MNFASIAQYLSETHSRIPPGPVAILFVEDLAEIAATVAHHFASDFHIYC